MKRLSVDYSKEAKEDLKGIKRYITYNLHEPQIAGRIVSKIRESIDSIKSNPEIYPIIMNNRIREFKIRKFIVCNYIVFYIIEDDKIIITRILHKKRNWINLL